MKEIFGPQLVLPLIIGFLFQLINAENYVTSTIISPTETVTSEINLASTDIKCSEKENPCQITEGQICGEEGFCKCLYPGLTYDNVTKKCLAKVGEQCGFFIGLKNASTVSCPDNAVCALINMEMATAGPNRYSNHQCACIYTHYKNDQGGCSPLGQHGESCDNKRKCSTEGELVCVDGKCQCQFKDDQYFDKDIGTCVSFAGGNCTRSCVSNAVCDTWGLGTCQCRLDHRLNSNRQCEPIPAGWNLPCLGNPDLGTQVCNTEIGLQCIDNVCQCKNPLHQIYDFQLDKCIGLAGDICDPEFSDNCVKNAKCVKTDGGNSHECKCVDGYSTTPFRKCMKSYQQQCSNEFCNVYRGLACINGSCMCYDSFLKYDGTSEACLSSEGSPCGKIYVPFPGDWVKSSCPECDSYYFACDETSICKRDFTEGNELGALEKFRCQLKSL